MLISHRFILGACPTLARCTPTTTNQHRSLMTKDFYDLKKKNVPKMPPWNYREKGYSWFDWFQDPKTTPRLDENSKLIIVEGNIGSGKSTLTKYLAEKFGLFHIEEFSMDKILVSSDGIDRRDHYHHLPQCYRWPDVKMFYENPRNPMNAKMQDLMFYGKCEDYCNAMAHITNTGQGVIMERSVYSDFVFANAMRGCDYLSRDFLVYDWEEPGDFDQIVEDMEKVNLDFYHKHSGDKWFQWLSVPNNNYWHLHRHEFTNKANYMDLIEEVPKWDCEELYEHLDDRAEANAYFKHIYGKIAPSQIPKTPKQLWNLIFASDGDKYAPNCAEPWFEHWYQDQWHHSLWGMKDQYDFDGDMKYYHEKP